MFDKISDLFQSGQDIPDLITVLDLEEWYRALSDEQRQQLYAYSTSVGIGIGPASDSSVEMDTERNMLDQRVTETTRSAQEYLTSVGSTAASDKEYEFAEFVLLAALERGDGSVTSTHFTYNELIDVYYKLRDDREDAIEKCVEYCKKDIEIAEEFVDEFGDVPRIPSFKRLAIIFEKQERYADALAVCEQALDIGTTDGTKGGFEGRKDRLREKTDG